VRVPGSRRRGRDGRPGSGRRAAGRAWPRPSRSRSGRGRR
jgi:hypothetical protein